MKENVTKMLNAMEFIKDKIKDLDIAEQEKLAANAADTELGEETLEVTDDGTRRLAVKISNNQLKLASDH